MCTTCSLKLKWGFLFFFKYNFASICKSFEMFNAALLYSLWNKSDVLNNRYIYFFNSRKNCKISKKHTILNLYFFNTPFQTNYGLWKCHHIDNCMYSINGKWFSDRKMFKIHSRIEINEIVLRFTYDAFSF